MTDDPITPPPELVQQWREQAPRYRDGGVGREAWLITVAYSAGADQELEALLVWLRVKGFDNLASDLLSARRPKPQSLKQQALCALIDGIERGGHDQSDIDTIRRALEALPDD